MGNANQNHNKISPHTRVANINTTRNNVLVRIWRKGNFRALLGEMYIAAATVESSKSINSTSGNLSKENKTLIWKGICTLIFTAALFMIAKIWKQQVSISRQMAKEDVISIYLSSKILSYWSLALPSKNKFHAFSNWKFSSSNFWKQVIVRKLCLPLNWAWVQAHIQVEKALVKETEQPRRNCGNPKKNWALMSESTQYQGTL